MKKVRLKTEKIKYYWRIKIPRSNAKVRKHNQIFTSWNTSIHIRNQWQAQRNVPWWHCAPLISSMFSFCQYSKHQQQSCAVHPYKSAPLAWGAPSCLSGTKLPLGDVIDNHTLWLYPPTKIFIGHYENRTVCWWQKTSRTIETFLKILKTTPLNLACNIKTCVLPSYSLAPTKSTLSQGHYADRARGKTDTPPTTNNVTHNYASPFLPR